MPAARPSKASVENALSAVAASGFAPTGLRVASDGSFEVDIAVSALDQCIGKSKVPSGDILTWDKVS
ncbi:MAG: hypothetical protein AAFO17_07245 [Pseudomonadota bacterium]